MADQRAPDFEHIRRLLAEKPKTVIITHFNPDGDAIGSSLAMQGYLAKQGLDAPVICPNDYPDFLSWLPGAPGIIVATKHEPTARKLLAEAGLIFCLDFNNEKRVEFLADALTNASGFKVLIDHHLQPENFMWTLSDIAASSTGELVYDFIHGLGDGDAIDSAIGTNLFAAIVTDTGSFQHDSTTAHAHRIVADLITRGVDTQKVIHRIYQEFSEGRIRFFGHCTLNKMKIRMDLGAAWITVSRAEMKQFKVTKGDLEGLVNIPLQIKGISFSSLLQEREGEVKISLRSTGTVDVNQMAREHFNGGGHRNAAGGKLKCSLEEAEKAFIDLIPKILQNTKPVTV